MSCEPHFTSDSDIDITDYYHFGFDRNSKILNHDKQWVFSGKSGLFCRGVSSTVKLGGYFWANINVGENIRGLIYRISSRSRTLLLVLSLKLLSPVISLTSYALSTGSESLNTSNTSSSHLPTKFSQLSNLHTFIILSLFNVLAVIVIHSSLGHWHHLLNKKLSYRRQTRATLTMCIYIRVNCSFYIYIGYFITIFV